MAIRELGYALYGRWLRARLAGRPTPRHVAIVMDGNRRWARQAGFDNVSIGHQHGAEHLAAVLGWCGEAGITQVTVFVASLDNLRKRSQDEVDFLMHLAERVLAEQLSAPGNRWQIRVAGQLDTLPDRTARALKQAAERTRDRDHQLTLAIGYDGRAEIVQAVRELLSAAAAAGTTTDELAETVEIEDIAAHLYTHGVPDPDLVIRTSGERRMGGFLLWQAAHSELHFCDVYWPGFRHIDFLRALRSYAARLG